MKIWDILKFGGRNNSGKIIKKGYPFFINQEILEKAETVREIADEVLQENGCHSCQCDDATVIDLDEDVVCTVEDFARYFWEKAVEKILNVVETQGR